jgi:hypothetical protein
MPEVTRLVRVARRRRVAIGYAGRREEGGCDREPDGEDDAVRHCPHATDNDASPMWSPERV